MFENKKPQNKGIIFILSSPSGGGKSSIARKLIGSYLNLSLSISVTTREKRTNEKEGIDYYYIDYSAYQKMLKEDELLESAEVYGYFYGTPRKFVLDHLGRGKDVLFDIDPQGAKAISKIKNLFSIVTIFILPPSLEELERRMHLRGDNIKSIEGRMSKAREYILSFQDYDYVVINDDFDKTCQDIASIFKAEKLKVKNQNLIQISSNYKL